MYLFAAIATLAASGAASSAAPASVRIEVSTDDVDLASPSGVATMAKRIRAAAAKACLEANGADAQFRSERAECRDAAVAGAMAELAVLAARPADARYAMAPVAKPAR